MRTVPNSITSAERQIMIIKIFKNTWKAVTSFIGGFLATLKSTGTPERAKPKKLSSSEKFTRTTPVCSYCLMQFKDHVGGVRAIPNIQHNIIQHHVQHCPSNPLVQKLEAAADALRQIECKCVGASDERLLEIGKFALEEWRKATK